MGGNIGSNGKIQVRNGEGISQAILREAGVSAEDVKKIKASDWSSIFNEVKNQQAQANNGDDGVKTLYSGGENLSGPANSNFVVHKNAVLEFTQQVWTNILNIINTALGRTDGNKLVYNAENTNNDTNGTTPPAGSGSAGSASSSTPTILNEEQTALKTQTETLMGNALGENKTITKGEQYGGSVITGYIYSYQEIPEGGKKQTVEVTTDADGKPTTVVLKDENDITTVTYDLTGKTMTIGIGSTATEITLDDTQLATIKEKAFLMANDKQLDDGKKAVTAIVTEYKDPNSVNTKAPYFNNSGSLVFELVDGRRVHVKLDDNNNITTILISEDSEDNDNSTNIYLDSDSNVYFDRDGKGTTTEDMQEMTLSNAELFNELAEQLQQLVNERTNEIAKLRDDAFSEKYKTQLNEGNAVVTAFQSAEASDITLTGEHENADGGDYCLELSDGKAITVYLGNDGKTIEDILIRMSDQNNDGPDDIPDIVYSSNGEVIVDPDYNDSTNDGNDADQTHTYVDAQASGYNDLKRDVIALLAKKGITDVE